MSVVVLEITYEERVVALTAPQRHCGLQVSCKATKRGYVTGKIRTRA